MATKRSQKTESPEPPIALAVSRDAAGQRIGEQIVKGQQLLERQIDSKEVLVQARADRRRWVDFTTELLKRLFTNDSLADEFAYVGPMVWGGVDSLQRDIRDYREDVREDINRLESIGDRLDLLPEPPTVEPRPAQPIPDPSTSQDVFLVHGHDEAAKQAAARFLERMGLRPVILHEQANAGMTVIEKVEEHGTVPFAVVLLTPDDVGAAKDDSANLKGRARQNVIFEFGYFIGKLGRGRVCALHKHGVELPSDISGLLYVEMDAAQGWHLGLARELKNAGFSIDMNKAVG